MSIATPLLFEIYLGEKMPFNCFFHACQSFEINAFRSTILVYFHLYFPCDGVYGKVFSIDLNFYNYNGDKPRHFGDVWALKIPVHIEFIKFLYTAHPWLKELLPIAWIIRAEGINEMDNGETFTPSE